MAMSCRQKLTLILLLFYWPAIFVLSHLPRVPDWVIGVPVSDKTLHYLAYLVLVFLLWFSINPDRKVNWRGTNVWWVLLVVVWYGALDEWLQRYVGRNPDLVDFLADLAGMVTTLVVLWIFSFWSASVAVTGVVIFVLTNFTRANPVDLLPRASTVFYLLAYAFFSLLWIRCIYHQFLLKAPQPKWLAAALVLPVAFLAGVELFSEVAGNGFKLWRVVISTAGIAGAVFTIFLIALLRWCRKQSLSHGDH